MVTTGIVIILWITMRMTGWFIAPDIESHSATALYFLIHFLCSLVLAWEVGILRVGTGEHERPSTNVTVLVSLAGCISFLSLEGISHEVAQTLQLLGVGAFGLWFGRQVSSTSTRNSSWSHPPWTLVQFLSRVVLPIPLKSVVPAKLDSSSMVYTLRGLSLCRCLDWLISHFR